MNSAQVHALYDPATSTLTYVVWNPLTRDAVVIDPVIDFDQATTSKAPKNIKSLLGFVAAQDLSVHWILDTHAHADHLSGARQLKSAWPGSRWAMSSGMAQVFATFREQLQWPKSLTLADLGVDRWLQDGEEFTAGSLRLRGIATPGHTPACMTFELDKKLFTGDCLMMPDVGTGRCDFPGGSAGQLYDSVWGKLYALPDQFLLYPGHDYPPGGRPVRFQSSLGQQKSSNVHLSESTSKADFVSFREARDKTLAPPKLLHPSLDWNLGAHQLQQRPS